MLHLAAGMTGGYIGHIILATDRGVAHIVTGAGRIAGDAVIDGAIVNIHNDRTFVVGTANEGIGHNAGDNQNGTNHIPGGHIASLRLVSGYDEAREQYANGGEG